MAPVAFKSLQDGLQCQLIEQEAIANFAARNKIRECLMLAMSKELARGGDGLKYITALEGLHRDAMASQEELGQLITKIS